MKNVFLLPDLPEEGTFGMSDSRDYGCPLYVEPDLLHPDWYQIPLTETGDERMFRPTRYQRFID